MINSHARLLIPSCRLHVVVFAYMCSVLISTVARQILPMFRPASHILSSRYPCLWYERTIFDWLPGTRSTRHPVGSWSSVTPSSTSPGRFTPSCAAFRQPFDAPLCLTLVHLGRRRALPLLWLGLALSWVAQHLGVARWCRPSRTGWDAVQTPTLADVPNAC